VSFRCPSCFEPLDEQLQILLRMPFLIPLFPLGQKTFPLIIKGQSEPDFKQVLQVLVTLLKLLIYLVKTYENLLSA
jgi:hypothetical protein